MGPETFDDLLSRAEAGDRAALGSLLESCRGYLLAVANAALEPELSVKGAGSDLVQETFLEADRAFEKFTGSDRDALLAWLKAILTNNIIDHRRGFRPGTKRDLTKEKALGPGEAEVSGGARSPSSQVSEREQTELFFRMLGRLPEEYRSVIELRNRDHLSFVEIGERMGRSADAVRMLWKRAVQRLQEELDQG